MGCCAYKDEKDIIFEQKYEKSLRKFNSNLMISHEIFDSIIIRRDERLSRNQSKYDYSIVSWETSKKLEEKPKFTIREIREITEGSDDRKMTCLSTNKNEDDITLTKSKSSNTNQLISSQRKDIEKDERIYTTPFNKRYIND